MRGNELSAPHEGKSGYRSDMLEEIRALQEEVAQLRAEVEALRARGCSNPEPAAATTAIHTVTALEIGDGTSSGRIKLTSGQDGPGIYLYDREGHCRALLEIREKGPSVELRSETEEPLIVLRSVDGHGQVSTAGPDGTPRAALRSTKHGGVVKVMNSRGRPLGYLLGSDRGGEMELLNASHRACFSAYADDDGGTIRVHEGSGEVMASLSANGDSGLLTVFGSLGEQAVTLCAGDDGGHVLLCDNDGNVTIDISHEAEPPEEESAADEEF